MKVKKAIIPAAGLGTRLLPATKAQPKEMLPLVDKPTIQYIVEEAAASGIENIVIVTGRGKRAIEDHFDKSYELEAEMAKRNKQNTLQMLQKISEIAEIYYIRQRQANGLGDAIRCARHFIGDQPCAILLGDDVVHAPQKPALRQLMEVYERYECSVLGVQRVSQSLVNQYGIVGVGEQLDDRLYRVSDLVEKPAQQDAPSDVAILGRYIVTPRLFDILERTGEGAGGEIQLTDALRELLTLERMLAYDFEGERYDMGNPQGYLRATVEFALRRPELREEFKQYLTRLQGAPLWENLSE